MSSPLKKLKYFDAYPKTLEDFRIKTLSGALISIFFTIIILILFINEWKSYKEKEIQQELFVDLTRNQKLRINLDILFPHLACDLVSIDAMDVSGETQLDVLKGIEKINLNKNGDKITIKHVTIETTTTTTQKQELLATNDTCGSCYGAETLIRKCCKTCDDVRDAYTVKGWQFTPVGVEQCKELLKELSNSDNNPYSHTFTDEQLNDMLSSGNGCRIRGNLLVNKVAGSFHLAPGSSFESPLNHAHVHDIKLNYLNLFNTTHFINEFYFGDTKYPSQINPLDNTWSESSSISSSIAYSYFIKTVPTTYQFENGILLNNTYQYSVTKSIKTISSSINANKLLPGLFFNYEFSPIMIKFIEKQKSLTHFITSCCAIIGGLFTIAGLCDSFIFKYYNLFKKYQINKLT